VLVAVITDGQENSSSDYDARTLARLLAHYEERGTWTFVYLGAHLGDSAPCNESGFMFTGKATERPPLPAEIPR